MINEFLQKELQDILKDILKNDEPEYMERNFYKLGFPLESSHWECFNILMREYYEQVISQDKTGSIIFDDYVFIQNFRITKNEINKLRKHCQESGIFTCSKNTTSPDLYEYKFNWKTLQEYLSYSQE
jgi:hypothetical protein